MHDETVAGDAGRLGEAELAERRDVGPEALLGEDAEHLDVRERLGAVGDQRVRRRGPVGARPGADRRLVVDEKRRAVFAGEIDRPHAAERQYSSVDVRAVGEELEHCPILPAVVCGRFFAESSRRVPDMSPLRR